MVGCDGDGRLRLFTEYKVFVVVIELELPRREGIIEVDDGEAVISLGARDGSCLCDDGENEQMDGDIDNSSVFVLCQLRVTVPDRPRGIDSSARVFDPCISVSMM